MPDNKSKQTEEELLLTRKALEAAVADGNDSAARELAARYRDLSIGDSDAMIRANKRFRELQGTREDRERMRPREKRAAGSPGDILPGAVRGATGVTGLPGDIGDMMPRVSGMPGGGVFMNPLQYLPNTNEQRQFLSEMGIDTTSGEGTTFGRSGEFVGGGAVGGVPNFIRQAAAGGIKGLAGSLARNIGASEAAFVGAEAGGELAENLGVDRAYGEVPGMFAPSLATSAITKGITGASQRARSANSRTARDRVMDADELNTAISAGTASPNTKTKHFERLLSSIPGGMRVMHDFAVRVNRQLVNNLRRVTSQTGRETAGIEIHSGINRGIQLFQRKSNALFNRASRAIPDDQIIRVKEFKATLDDMSVELPKTLDEVAEALGKDSSINAESMLAAVNKMDRGVGAMTFQEADALRRYIGRQINNTSVISDAGRHTDLKRLYGALTEDVSTDLTQTQKYLWDSAKKHWKDGRENIDNFLQPVIGKPGNTDFEKVFDAVFKDNARSVQRIRSVYSALTPQQRDIATKAFIYRLGRVGEEAGGITMDFKMSTFLNKWKDIPEENLKILFQDSPDLMKNMNAFVRHIDEILTTNAALANPSQSGPVGLAAATAYLTLAGMTGAAAGAVLGSDGEKDEAALVGALVGAGGLVATTRAAAAAARLMTNPRFVEWLARGTRAPNIKTTEHFGQLVALGRGDPNMEEALSYFMDELQLTTDQRNLLNDGIVGPRVELAESQ